MGSRRDRLPVDVSDGRRWHHYAEVFTCLLAGYFLLVRSPKKRRKRPDLKFSRSYRPSVAGSRLFYAARAGLLVPFFCHFAVLPRPRPAGAALMDRSVARPLRVLVEH